MTTSLFSMAAPPSSVEHATTSSHPSLSKQGMWVFLASDAVTFATLLVSCALIRTWSRDWPTPAQALNLPLAGVMTCLLLASSGTMAFALSALARGTPSYFRGYLLLTLVGGLGFILLQAWEWSHLLRQGLALSSNPWGAQLFGASFYVLTGFHGCHVIAGIIYIAVVWFQGLRGVYHGGNMSPVVTASLYWYFVDVSWLFILLVVYGF